MKILSQLITSMYNLDHMISVAKYAASYLVYPFFSYVYSFFKGFSSYFLPTSIVCILS